MIWLIAILCFAVGLFVGAVLFKQFMSDAVKIEQLEEKLDSLQSDYDHYQSNVHSHFSGTAQLVDKLTDSYREVYRHLASGAQSLCPESISSQLTLSAQNHDLISDSSLHGIPSYQKAPNGTDSTAPLFPPRDYADKSSPDQKGNLAEDYGLDKIFSEETEESLKTPE